MEMLDVAYLARRPYELWNERAFDRFGEAFADDAELMIVGSGTTFSGPSGAIEFAHMWADAFPDARVEIDHMVVAGKYAVVEVTARGTHSGPLRAAGKTVEATGRSITLELCDVVEIGDEKIQTVRSYFDSGSLMMQLGMMAEAGTEMRVRT